MSARLLLFPAASAGIRGVWQAFIRVVLPLVRIRAGDRSISSAQNSISAVWIRVNGPLIYTRGPGRGCGEKRNGPAPRDVMR